MFVALLPLFGAVTIAAADTITYPVLNHGRPAGEMIVIRSGDSVVVRYRYIDRNRGQRSETRYRFAPRGELVAAEVRPMTLDGQPAGPPQGFEVAGDSVRWFGRVGGAGRGGRGGGGGGGRGETGAPVPTATKRESNVMYRVGGTPFDQVLVARYLLAQPNRTGRLYPNVTASAEITREATVTTRAGSQRVRFVTVSIPGNGPTPSGVWLDAKNDLFAGEVSWFITVRPGAERALPALRAVEIAYRNGQAEALARRLTKPVTGALVIRNGDVFDSERAVVMPRTTVVIQGDRITAVGPTDAVAVPAGATVIDATGKTVIPGLVDAHTHFQLTSQSTSTVLELAGGITTIRDMAADVDIAVSHRDRANAGTILSPRVILAGFLEGPGAWAGPSDVLVRTEDEARAWIARYDSLGYKQIKLYNIIHPDLVPTIAAEAHKRGMRLSGHIPRGLSVPAAIELGFDEIQHGAFLFSTFFQDSLYLPTMRAYSAVAAAVAPTINVDGAEMTALIDVLKKHNTVIDGTFNIWQGAQVLSGQDSPASTNYGKLVKRLYDAGITLVPGTDANTVQALLTELELYEHDGIPAPNVLQIATLNPARVMKEDKDYGSITVGKVADLAIVNGKPAEKIADLMKVEQVVRAGRLYDSATLKAVFRTTVQ
jgi:imidazolonepropionase-like amidohydrolase